MPNLEQKYPETQNFKDFEVGKKLTITKAVMGETENEKYECVTLTCQGIKLPVFTTNGAVIYHIRKIADSISESDPLKVVVSEYTNQHGIFKTIKNL